jgi:hypothetical protein
LLPDGDGNLAAFWTGGPAGLTDAAVETTGPLLIAGNVPTNVVALKGVSFDATFVDLWSSLAGPPTWSFGDGTTKLGAQTAHTYALPGTYTVTVTATDTAGNATTETYDVVAGPPVPVLSGVGQTVARWRLGTAPYSLVRSAGSGGGAAARARRRAPVGTTLRLTLNVAATVTFRFTLRRPGRVVHRSCRTPTKRNRRDRACTIDRAAGSFRIATPAGASTLRFAGELAGRARLAPGAYTLTLTATGVDGTSSPRTLRFTIVST